MNPLLSEVICGSLYGFSTCGQDLSQNLLLAEDTQRSMSHRIEGLYLSSIAMRQKPCIMLGKLPDSNDSL